MASADVPEESVGRLDNENMPSALGFDGACSVAVFVDAGGESGTTVVSDRVHVKHGMVPVDLVELARCSCCRYGRCIMGPVDRTGDVEKPPGAWLAASSDGCGYTADETGPGHGMYNEF